MGVDLELEEATIRAQSEARFHEVGETMWVILVGNRLQVPLVRADQMPVEQGVLESLLKDILHNSEKDPQKPLAPESS